MSKTVFLGAAIRLVTRNTEVKSLAWVQLIIHRRHLSCLVAHLSKEVQFIIIIILFLFNYVF